MRIAIIGSGISGLVCTYLLSRQHHITLFEANDYIGGHTNTIGVEEEGEELPVDTGFIVFNDRTYPSFNKLLEQLGVSSQPTDMSFSVKCESTGLEYNGHNLNTLFAQRSNLIKPYFYRLLLDILLFNKAAQKFLSNPDQQMSLGDFLQLRQYSRQFRDYYIIPMGSAIWSIDHEKTDQFPAHTFLRFFANHGLLSIGNRPQWKVIKGGSQTYVRHILDCFKGEIRMGSKVTAVKRSENKVTVSTSNGDIETYDAVIVAAHSDQALKMLSDPSEDEKRILGAIPYQKNFTVLHTDTSVLPKRSLARACWNSLIPSNPAETATLTYNMNLLQSLSTKRIYNVTLNYTEKIARNAILKELVYHHPVFTSEGIRCQKQKRLISGKRNTYYCGAYWGYGFHEDGVNSALEVCQHFGIEL